MSRIRDRYSGGYQGGQDHDQRIKGRINDLGQKRLDHATRVTRDNKDNLETHADKKTGPVVGLHLWDSSNFLNTPPIWSYVFPAVSSGVNSYSLVRGPSWTNADTRWRTEGTPAAPNKSLYPIGWSFLSVQGTEENKQHTMMFPGFNGLVAPHCGGSPELGTSVFDLTNSNELDDNIKAPLQSLMRVYQLPNTLGTLTKAFHNAGGAGAAINGAPAGVGVGGLQAGSAGKVGVNTGNPQTGGFLAGISKGTSSIQLIGPNGKPLGLGGFGTQKGGTSVTLTGPNGKPLTLGPFGAQKGPSNVVLIGNSGGGAGGGSPGAAGAAGAAGAQGAAGTSVGANFGLAWQLGGSRGGRPGFGIVADQGSELAPAGSFSGPSTRTKPNTTTVARSNPQNKINAGIPAAQNAASQGQTLASISVSLGGFCDVGGGNDPHNIGTSGGKNETINSAHLSTKSLFRGGPGDGGMAFEDDIWVPPFGGPYDYLTHLRWDPDGKHPWMGQQLPGQWRFETEGFFRVEDIGDPFEEPKDAVPGNPDFFPKGPGPVTGPKERFTRLGASESFSTKISSVPPRNVSTVGTELELFTTSWHGRAGHWEAGKPDFRYAVRNKALFVKAAIDKQLKAPASIRSEVIGSQNGCNWDYTQQPRRVSRYPSGTTNGGLWYMPPERGMESVNDIANVSTAISSTHLGLWDVDLVFGTPLPSGSATGANRGGYSSSFYFSKTSNGLELLATDPDGAQVVGQTWTVFEGGDITHQAENGVIQCLNTSGGAASTIKLGSSRGTIASPTASDDDDILGEIVFNSYDTFSQEGANILAVAEAGGSGGFQEIGLRFSVMDAGTLYETMQLNASGFVQFNGNTIVLEKDAAATGQTLVRSTSGTGQVTATIQHASGTLAYLSDVGIPSSTAPTIIDDDFTAAVNTSYAMRTSVKSITATLPTITAAIEGSVIEISDIEGSASTNNWTIATDGSDFVLGGTTWVVSSNYTGFSLRAVIYDSQGYWMVI